MTLFELSRIISF